MMSRVASNVDSPSKFFFFLPFKSVRFRPTTSWLLRRGTIQRKKFENCWYPAGKSVIKSGRRRDRKKPITYKRGPLCNRNEACKRARLGAFVTDSRCPRAKYFHAHFSSSLWCWGEEALLSSCITWGITTAQNHSTPLLLVSNPADRASSHESIERAAA